MAIAFRILRDADQADDAVQAALIASWRDIRRLRDVDRFEPWLHRTLARACYEEARQARRFAGNVRSLPLSAMSTPDGAIGVAVRDHIDRPAAVGPLHVLGVGEVLADFEQDR